MVTFTINIPQMLACIPYMDPMGNDPQLSNTSTIHQSQIRRAGSAVSAESSTSGSGSCTDCRFDYGARTVGLLREFDYKTCWFIYRDAERERERNGMGDWMIN